MVCVGDSTASPRREELYLGLGRLDVGAEVHDGACPPREQAFLLLTSHSGIYGLKVLYVFESYRVHYALPFNDLIIHILWLDCSSVVLAHMLMIPST